MMGVGLPVLLTLFWSIAIFLIQKNMYISMTIIGSLILFAFIIGATLGWKSSQPKGMTQKLKVVNNKHAADNPGGYGGKTK